MARGPLRVNRVTLVVGRPLPIYPINVHRQTAAARLKRAKVRHDVLEWRPFAR
jgi:hypothetical protein